MYKKLIAVLTAAVLFTSCAFTEKVDKAKERVNEVKKEVYDKLEDLLLTKEGRMAKELGENVLTAIQNEDVDALADLFCQYTVDEYGDDLKPEIQNLYDYIDGKIVSHGKINPDTFLQETTEEDGAVIYCYSAIIGYIITDKENEYVIVCSGYTIYKDHPELVGFVELYVEDRNKFRLLHQNNEINVDPAKFSYQIGELPEEPLV